MRFGSRDVVPATASDAVSGHADPGPHPDQGVCCAGGGERQVGGGRASVRWRARWRRWCVAAVVHRRRWAPAAAAPPTADGPTAAAYATAWLAEQLDAQIPMQNFGSPDWGVTLDAALGHGGCGVRWRRRSTRCGPRSLVDRDAAVAPDGMDDPGRLARVILLAVATGEDPTLGRRRARGRIWWPACRRPARTSGPDRACSARQNPTYDGAFRQGYALAALVAAGRRARRRARSTGCWPSSAGPRPSVGAWMPYRADLSVPCAVDAATCSSGPTRTPPPRRSPDCAAVGAGGAAIEAGLGWLDSVQEADGGWGQMVGYGTDPNSTALVLQALLAVGAADDARFADRAATPLEALLSFQLGCDAPEADRGAFTFPGSNGAPNGFATAQAVGAGAGAPVLFEPGEVAAGVTPLDCTPATPRRPDHDDHGGAHDRGADDRAPDDRGPDHGADGGAGAGRSGPARARRPRHDGDGGWR